MNNMPLQIPSKYKQSIDILVKDLKPIRPHSVGFIYTIWMILSLLFGVVGIFTIHFRPDFVFQLKQFSFFSTFILSFLGFGLVSFGVFLSGFPGYIRKAMLWFLSGLFIWGVWISIYFVQLAFMASGDVPFVLSPGIKCSMTVLAFSSFPIGVAIFFIRKLSPTRLLLTGVGVFLTASVFGNLVLAFHCPATDPIHILVWHIFPCGIISGVGALLSTRLFKW